MPPGPSYTIVLLVWAAWLMIWVVASNRAAPTQQHDERFASFAYRGPIVLAIVLLLFPRVGAGSAMDVRFIEPSAAAFLLGSLVLLGGFVLGVWARIRLGAHWSGRVAVVRGQALVCTGPYRFVRHPMYLAAILGVSGTAILFGDWRSVAALLIIATALCLKLRREELLMESVFDEGYVAYRRRVPALVPHAWRQRL